MDSLNHFSKFENELPIKFGQNQMDIIDLLGEPDRELLYDSYLRYGFLLGYDTNEELDMIWATTMEGGKTFSGKIFGVKIGDPFSLCENLWGPFIRELDKNYDYKTAFWDFDILTIEIEYWSENGKEEDFGEYFKGNVKSIKIQHIK